MLIKNRRLVDYFVILMSEILLQYPQSGDDAG